MRQPQIVASVPRRRPIIFGYRRLSSGCTRQCVMDVASAAWNFMAFPRAAGRIRRQSGQGGSSLRRFAIEA